MLVFVTHLYKQANYTTSVLCFWGSGEREYYRLQWHLLLHSVGYHFESAPPIHRWTYTVLPVAGGRGCYIFYDFITLFQKIMLSHFLSLCFKKLHIFSWYFIESILDFICLKIRAACLLSAWSGNYHPPITTLNYLSRTYYFSLVLNFNFHLSLVFLCKVCFSTTSGHFWRLLWSHN